MNWKVDMSLERSKSKLATVALISALAVVPLGAGAAYLSGPALAQSAQTPPPPPGAGGPQPGPGMRGMGPGMRGMGPDGQHGWGDRSGRMHHHGRHGNMQMRLAEKLAAVETAIGVRSDQLDAWRDFTSKLVAFATPPWQQGRGPGMKKAGAGQPPLKAGNAQGDATAPDMPPASANSFGILSRMVDGAIRHGDQAKQLKESMQKLESVLTPQQIRMARTLMRPDRGMSRHHHGWNNWHRDHMWHGRHDGRGFGPGGGNGGFGGPGPDDGQQQ